LWSLAFYRHAQPYINDAQFPACGLRTQAALQAEILALRHQLIVLQRTQKKKRLILHAADRLLWVWLSRLWLDWRSALVIVKPATVIAWHRQGFRWYWTWKIRHGRTGRPSISKETRDLIRSMSRDNPLWGSPRIHGELLKLGINVSQASVAKYMVRPRKPLSSAKTSSADRKTDAIERLQTMRF
jgi:putative transposase